MRYSGLWLLIKGRPKFYSEHRHPVKPRIGINAKRGWHVVARPENLKSEKEPGTFFPCCFSPQRLRRHIRKSRSCHSSSREWPRLTAKRQVLATNVTTNSPSPNGFQTV